MGFHVSSLTCTVDGKTHLVSDDAASAGIVAGLGTYLALCGHTVHVAAMVSSAGPLCPHCALQAEQVRDRVAHEPRRRRRGGRTGLRRLLGQRRVSAVVRPATGR